MMRVASLFLLLTTAAVAGAGAQSTSRPQRPTSDALAVEPRLTRLFGSDSLEMGWPVLSPDGRWIVFGTYEAEKGNIWVVPAAGGEPVRLTTGLHRRHGSPTGSRGAGTAASPTRSSSTPA